MDAVVAIRPTLDSRAVTPTPLDPAPVSLAQGRDVWLKREDEHELGAFKWRGALPAMRAFRDAGQTTVVTASTGNHGAASAWAAARLGMRAIVYAPEGSARAKLDLIERHGGEIRVFGADFDLAKDEAERVAAAEGVPFFADGAEEAQYGGYAEIADEVLDQLDRPPGAIVVPVGNGALLGGIGLRLAERLAGDPAGRRRRGGRAGHGGVLGGRAARRGGCASHHRRRPRGRVAIPYAVDVLTRTAQRMLRVDERELALAIGALGAAGIRVEASAAAALAALPQVEAVDGPVVLIVTGRNIDEALYRRAVDDPGSFPTRNATA